MVDDEDLTAQLFDTYPDAYAFAKNAVQDKEPPDQFIVCVVTPEYAERRLKVAREAMNRAKTDLTHTFDCFARSGCIEDQNCLEEEIEAYRVILNAFEEADALVSMSEYDV